MRSLILLLVLLLPLASALEIDQSFRGTGEWSSCVNLGAAGYEMSGVGDMSYAAKSKLTPDGAALKSGLEFDGINGRARISGRLGPDLKYRLQAKEARNISLRSSIDISTEETQDSNIGELLLYGVSIDGRINGTILEEIDNGKRMGRPVELSATRFIGIFEINSTVSLKEYQAGYNNEG